MQLVHKSGLTVRKGIDVDAALVPAKVSVLEIDRDNEVTLPQGFRHRNGLRHFKTNPTVYFGHQSFGLPIGKANQLKLNDDHVFAVTKMATEVQGPVGDHVRGVFDLMVQGFLNAWSVGFWFDDFLTERDEMAKVLEGIGNDAAKAVLADLDTVRRMFTRNRLAEYSSVGIGSSPSSLTERGYDGHELAPEIKELLQFGAEYDVAKDSDWLEWLRYTESASINVDPEPVTSAEVECHVIDACQIDLADLVPESKTATVDDDDGDGKLELDPSAVSDLVTATTELAAATKELLAATGELDELKATSAAAKAAIENDDVAVVWHDGEIALQIALDDDELGEKLVVPLTAETREAINRKAETLADLAVLEGLTGESS